MRQSRKLLLLIVVLTAFVALQPLTTQAVTSMYVANNGDVGFGTLTPATRIDARGDGVPISVWGTTHANAASSQFALRRARGSSAAPTAVQSGDALGSFGFRGFNGSAFTFDKALIAAVAEEAWTPGANGSRLFFSTTAIGGTTLTPRMMIKHDGRVGVGTLFPQSLLHVNGGDIRISGGSFIDDGVSLNAPDYVFEPDYSLMPIHELREFIEREKHLPNVPSAREVKAQGLNLSQFQMKLLEKVEELTLYTIDQQDQIQSQQEQLSRLQELNVRLMERLDALEKRPVAGAAHLN